MIASLVLGNEIKSIIFVLLSGMAGKIAYDIQVMGLLKPGANLKKLLIFFVLVFHSVAFALWYLEVPLFDFRSAGGENFFRIKGEKYRLFGTLVNPNSYAVFCVIIIIYLLFDAHKSSLRHVSIIFSITAVILTGSRAGLICLTITIIFKLLSRYRFHCGLVFVKFLALIFSLIVIILFSGQLTGVDIRFSKWLAGWQTFSHGGIYIFYGLPISELLGTREISFSDNMILFDVFRHGVLFGTINIIGIITFSLWILSRSQGFLNGEVTAIFCGWILLFTMNLFLIFPSILFWFVYFGSKIGRARFEKNM